MEILNDKMSLALLRLEMRKRENGMATLQYVSHVSTAYDHVPLFRFQKSPFRTDALKSAPWPVHPVPPVPAHCERAPSRAEGTELSVELRRARVYPCVRYLRTHAGDVLCGDVNAWPVVRLRDVYKG